jgi:hypothetical protein
VKKMQDLKKLLEEYEFPQKEIEQILKAWEKLPTEIRKKYLQLWREVALPRKCLANFTLLRRITESIMLQAKRG